MSRPSLNLTDAEREWVVLSIFAYNHEFNFPDRPKLGIGQRVEDLAKSQRETIEAEIDEMVKRLEHLNSSRATRRPTNVVAEVLTGAKFENPLFQGFKSATEGPGLVARIVGASEKGANAVMSVPPNMSRERSSTGWPIVNTSSSVFVEDIKPNQKSPEFEDFAKALYAFIECTSTVCFASSLEEYKAGTIVNGNPDGGLQKYPIMSLERAAIIPTVVFLKLTYALRNAMLNFLDKIKRNDVSGQIESLTPPVTGGAMKESTIVPWAKMIFKNAVMLYAQSGAEFSSAF